MILDTKYDAAVSSLGHANSAHVSPLEENIELEAEIELQGQEVSVRTTLLCFEYYFRVHKPLSFPGIFCFTQLTNFRITLSTVLLRITV